MRETVEEAARLLEQGEPCVMATVVRTKGSTPQKPGAQLLVRKDGSGIGTLGGGCVEGDIWYAAKEILRKGDGPEYKDYLLNEDIAARDGLVCGGSMYFFLEPLRGPEDFLPYAREMMEAYESGRPVSVATVVRSDSGRGEMGARLLLRDDGSTKGTLGDEELDRMALEAASQVADLGNNKDIMTHDGVEIFVEGVTTPPTLVLVGGGHVARATYNLAVLLGYRIYVVDDREEFSNSERFPDAAGTFKVPDYGHSFEDVPINANTFIVVATRGHWFDDVALEAAVKTPAKYIGLLGSRRKTIMIYQRLVQLGMSPERLKAVHAPVGLDIGARTPEELAVSIMSEIIMFRHDGKGGSMKMEERYFDRAVGKALAGQAASD